MTESSMPELRKSPHWDTLKESVGFIEYGFPFQEGFPADIGPLDAQPPMFELIFRDGTRLIGSVDFSTQYRAEGLRWQTTNPNLRNLTQGVIAAWCELPEETQA